MNWWGETERTARDFLCELKTAFVQTQTSAEGTESTQKIDLDLHTSRQHKELLNQTAKQNSNVTVNKKNKTGGTESNSGKMLTYSYYEILWNSVYLMLNLKQANKVYWFDKSAAVQPHCETVAAFNLLNCALFCAQVYITSVTTSKTFKS